MQSRYAVIIAVLLLKSVRLDARKHDRHAKSAVQMLRFDYTAPLNSNFSGSVSQNVSRQYVFTWSNSSSELTPFRLYLSAPNARTRSWPLVAVANQGGSVLTLTLPFLFTQHSEGGKPHEGAPEHYGSITRTVCPPQLVRSDNVGMTNEAIVELSTSSLDPIEFTISATLVQDFALTVGSSQLVQLQPSAPQYYFFNFSDNESQLNGAKAVRVVAQSDPNSEDSRACMTLAIHSGHCPVGDEPENVDHTGLFQTVLSLGDIYVSRAEYPTFFVVLLSHPSTEKCDGNFDTSSAEEGLPFYNFTKHIKLKLISAPEPNALLLLGVVFVLLVASTAVVLAAVCAFKRFPPQLNGEQQGAEEDPDFDSDAEPLIGSRMSVALLNKRSADRHAYFLQLFVISVFYCLPAVQLMWVLSNNIYNGGNLDKCFYNYACSVKLRVTYNFTIYSFNNVFSNIGYLAAGATFILVCRAKKKRYENCRTGVPDCYGLYYACGAAIFMEGVMSATYHLCPSYYNFQYDTAFMLMIAGLLTLLIYSKRHPDANVTAQVAYLALGAFILANTLGILLAQYPASARVVYLCLAVVHILLVVKLTCQVYYLGEVSIRQAISYLFTRSGPTNFPYPSDSRPTGYFGWCCRQLRYPKTLAFLAVGVALNLIAICLYVAHGFGMLNSLMPFKFAEIFLFVMIMNFLLYLAFYLIVKVCTARRSEWRSVGFVLLLVLASAVLSGFALHFFVNSPTDWTQSPANSRVLNTECILFDAFDKHDVWHFLSACALFCVLMLIFCVDMNDRGKQRDRLPVF
ncbi:hypothetical protein BOX15_Mlig027904g1 [Macrostomum lignano]|uniref:Uncharacterized protein n=1 Tax=Macrostomum lignano TaxID=282301 RepID=A0A267F0N8_9PLAT|nr:hypothetical protein BOX15_Mlig027904g2 [Macrostomum lignano]PAA66649.1 hypothetical protein BOX15_Mlig027904g1 [Macrostomum lignano]